MSKIGDLFVRLGLKKDEFSRGIKDAKKETEGFGIGLKNMAAGAKVAWAAVAAAVVKFATDAVKMTQKWGDEWKTMMAGVNAAYGSFVRQLASGEGFSNLFANMREAARLAREAARELDEVFERTTSYNYTEAQTNKEIAQLQLIMRDSSKSDKERMAAAQQIIQKTEELGRLKKEIATQEADGYRKQLKSQTQMNDDEINFLVREYNQNKAIIDQGRAYLNERKQAQKDKTWLSIGAALDDTPGGSALGQMRDDAAQRVKDLDAATSQAVKDVAAVLQKYYKGNDELISNLAKAEVAVINVDTAMYHAQMRATSMLGSLSKAGSGVSTGDTTDPGAEAAAKIQQRAVDSAKSELHLLAEKYNAEKALLQQYGMDTEALTKEYEANTYKILLDYTNKRGANAQEREALLREAYKAEKDELQQAGIDITTLTDTFMKRLLEISDEGFQEFVDQLDEEFPIELEPIEIVDDEFQAWLDQLERNVERAKEITEDFHNAVVAGFSDACQEMADQLFGLEDFNPASVIKALLDPLCKMAITAGEIIMLEGIATVAAKDALLSFGWTGYGAIAAGAALMAAGAAASAGLAALAKNGGSATSSSTYQGGGGAASTQTIKTELEVVVTGRISGRDLVLSGQRTVSENNR